MYMRRHLRSANCHPLAVRRFRLNAYDRRAFSVAGPRAWNSLPDFIRDPTSSTDCLGVYLKRTCSRDTSAPAHYMRYTQCDNDVISFHIYASWFSPSSCE